MKKAVLDGRIVERSGRGQAASMNPVDGVVAIIGKTVAGGAEVRIAKFGTFGARSRPSCTRWSLGTGEAVAISALTSPALKAGKTPKDAASEGAGSCCEAADTVSWTIDRLDFVFRRLQCNDGHFACFRDVPGKGKVPAMLTDGLRPVWMLYHVCRK